MATITKPMALDESFNTTESTSRNQADVLVGIESAIRQGFGRSAADVSYDNTTSGLTADDVQEAIDELAEEKADTSEVTEVDTPDTTPFLYRQTPHNADGVFLDELVGGSVAWNQLAKELNATNWFTENATVSYADGVATLTPSAQYGRLNQYINYVANHKMFVIADVKLSNSDNANLVEISIYGVDTFASQTSRKCRETTDWQTIYTICYESSNLPSQNRIMIGDVRSSNWGTIQVKNVQCIDLTQMFGTTIADYVYSLEQATAGSGIAWLKSHGFFTKDYYPYNTGELVSVKTSGKKYVGKNLFDNSTFEKGRTDNGVIGYASGTDSLTVENGGVSFTVNTAWRGVVSGHVKVKSNTEYCLSYTATNDYISFVDCYDKNGDWISPQFTSVSGSFTTHQGTSFVRVSFEKRTTGTVSVSNLQLEEGSTATPYEPYTERTYDISNIDLRGIPKLVNNELVYDGDTYDSNGDVTRKYKRYNLGDFNWVVDGHDFYSTEIVDAPSVKSGGYNTAICSKYVTFVGTNISNMPDKSVSFCNSVFSGTKMFVIRDSSYSDVSTFKTAMDGIYIDAQIATPTTETTDPYTNPQICDKDGTEEFIDDRTVPVPVGHNSRYADLPAIMDGDYLSYMAREIEKCAVDAEFMQFTDGTDTFTDVNLSLDASLHTVSVVGSKIEQKRFICFEVMDKMGGVLQGILASCIAFTDGAKTPSGTAFRAYIESLQMYVNFRIYGSGGSYTLAYQSETSFSASAFFVRVRMMNNL